MIFKYLFLIFCCFVTAMFGAAVENRVRRSATRCYEGDIGCFSNGYPFNNSDGALPLPADRFLTRFLLFTNQNPQHSQEIVINNIHSIQTAGFDSTLPTKFIIHGFIQNGRVAWIYDMARSLLRRGRMNVIVADWGWGSGWPYTQAVANTRLSGAEIASMIRYLNNATGTTNSQFHLIGHSLGAHVAGYAGDRLPGLTRITGLDPAEPNFKNTDPAVRLDPTDANFVDVIHTDGSEFNTISGYGMIDPVGHVDFYPNGGKYQPGCPEETWTSVVTDVDHGVEQVGDDISCSHSRAIFLFTESINSDCPFLAYPCDNYNRFQQGNCFDCGNRPCPRMGFDSDRYIASGKHYLSTTNDSPYCGYHYHVNIEFGHSMGAETGNININILGSGGLSEVFTIDTTDRTFMPHQMRDAMFVSHTDLGDVLQVQVTYHHTGGFFNWIWGSQISISTLSVQRGKTNHRWLFCGNELPLRNGQTRSYHNAVQSHRECSFMNRLRHIHVGPLN